MLTKTIRGEERGWKAVKSKDLTWEGEHGRTLRESPEIHVSKRWKVFRSQQYCLKWEGYKNRQLLELWL